MCPCQKHNNKWNRIIKTKIMSDWVELIWIKIFFCVRVTAFWRESRKNQLSSALFGSSGSGVCLAWFLMEFNPSCWRLVPFTLAIQLYVGITVLCMMTPSVICLMRQYLETALRENLKTLWSLLCSGWWMWMCLAKALSRLWLTMLALCPMLILW